jgi:predicted DNA-binding protein
MKIAITLSDQIMTRLSNQMQRNGQSAAEVIRTAMIQYFDHQDNWYTPDNPLIMAPRDGKVQSESVDDGASPTP